MYKEISDNGGAPLVLHISGWRGTHSLRCYMSQHSTVHLLRLLGGDISKFGKEKMLNNTYKLYFMYFTKLKNCFFLTNYFVNGFYLSYF